MTHSSHFPRSEYALQGRTILQIIPQLNSGGAERATLEIAEALAQAGGRALVASAGGRLVADLQARGGEFHAFPATRKNPLSLGLNTLRLNRLIREEGVDLIHARSRAPAWAAFGAAWRCRIPFVTTYHGVYSARTRLKLRYNSIMARGDAIIANSAFTASHIEKNYPFAAGRISLIARGVDLSGYCPDQVSPERVRELRKKWRVAPDQRIVLLPARLTRRKGHLILIEAARHLAAAGRTDLVFIFAGDAESPSYAREIDRAIGGENFIRRVGYCEDMPAAYIASACIAAPSIEAESFGRVAIEAQAMGTPIVVSDLGATPETVLAPPENPGVRRTGWRTPPNDPKALSIALGEALDLGAAARDALAIRARMHVRDNFTIERMRERTLALYARLLAGNSLEKSENT